MDASNDYNIVSQDTEEVNLREILFKYLYHWKWFALAVIIFLCLGLVYIKISTPLYQIETDLLIKQDKNTPNGGGDDILKSLDLFSSDKVIDNEVQILKSYTLMEKIVKTLGLEVSYFQNGRARKVPLYQNLPFRAELLKPNADSYKEELKVQVINGNEVEIDGKKASFNRPIQTEIGLVLLTVNSSVISKFVNAEIDINFNDLPTFYQNYSKLLSITPISKEGTVLIITYQDAIPKRGEDILNRLVDEYNNAAVEDKNKVTTSTLNFIQGRLSKLAEELGTAEKDVENYKSSNRITDISAQSQVFMQSVQQNDAELSKVNIQLSVLQNLESYTHSADDKQQLPSMLGVDDPTLLGLVSKLGDAELRKQSLLQTIPETNPIVTSLNDQIGSLKKAINQSVQNLKSGLGVTKQQLDRKNIQFQSVIRQVPSKERGLLDVMRQQDIKNTLFNFLLQKREEQEMSLVSNLADSRTIDIARSTPLPVKPVKPLIMIIFFVLGLLIPITIIYLRELLNNKVAKRSDIEKATKAPILAEISHSDEETPLIVVEKPRSMVSEQIRALRTNLQFIGSDQNHKVLLFTSGTSGEGKSFVSLNLGASLAMSGKKVVILELDLRKPKLHTALKMDNDKGLSNYLISTYDYHEVIKSVPQQSNYFIITSGLIPPNPAELLTNGRINVLIDELKQDFDFVIIDAPPVGLVTDAQILSRYANATMFIVRHNYTFKSQILLIDELYRNKKFSNLNIVFNSVDYSSSSYAYGYGHGYGYGYGYGGGYYQEEKPKKRAFGFFKRK